MLLHLKEILLALKSSKPWHIHLVSTFILSISFFWWQELNEMHFGKGFFLCILVSKYKVYKGWTISIELNAKYKDPKCTIKKNFKVFCLYPKNIFIQRSFCYRCLIFKMNIILGPCSVGAVWWSVCLSVCSSQSSCL